MEFLNTHTNLPLDRLMQDLSNQGFRITPDMYVRVQTILQELGKDYYKPDEEDTYKKLAYIIAPIVVKNPQEQQIFDEVFDDYVEYLEQEARAFKASQEEKPETSLDEEIKPPIKEEWYRKPLIWLGVLGVLLTALGSYFFLNQKPTQISDDPAIINAGRFYHEIGDSIYFGDIVDNYGIDSTNFLWRFDDTLDSFNLKPFRVYEKQGMYKTSLDCKINGVKHQINRDIYISCTPGVAMSLNHSNGEIGDTVWVTPKISPTGLKEIEWKIEGSPERIDRNDTLFLIYDSPSNYYIEALVKNINCITNDSISEVFATATVLIFDTLKVADLEITVGVPDDYTELVGHENKVWSVNFSPYGKYLATSSEDKTVRIWSLINGKEKEDSLQVYEEPIRSVAFSPNGKYLATGSEDNTARIWSIKNKEQFRSFEKHGYDVRSVVFSPNGEYLATGSRDNTARIWSIADGKEIKLLQHEAPVWSVAFSPDGKYLATASQDRIARIWSIEKEEVKQLLRHDGQVWSVSFSPDGEYLAATSGNKTVRIWSVKDGNQWKQLEGHTGNVWSVAFSPNGELLATASEDNTARIWSVQKGEEIGQLSEHQDPVRSVAFSPDGKYLATASQDSTARIWNVSSIINPTDYLNTQPTKKAYFYPFLLFLLLTALATYFNRLNKTKPSPFAPPKNAQAPYKIPFPEQAVIPATPQVYQLAKMLRQRQAGWRYRMDIPATVRATIAKGGFPVIRQRGNTRAPEYLFLIDLETPDAQQVSWLEYVLQLLRREEVLMACYYFKQDPSWCWNREQPDGLDIDELYQRFPDHRLVIYGDGDYWLDSFEARTDERVLRDFPLWSQRALLTTVPPENWSYRERLLQQYFNLIPGDMKEPLVLASALMTQAEDFEQIRQDRSRSTDRFIEFNSLDDIRDFLAYDKNTTHTPLLDWLAATTVYPEPQWEITLALGKALEQLDGYEGILTLPNLRHLTQIKWMNRDAFPENLRQDLLAHLHTRPQAKECAEETVRGLLKTVLEDEELNPNSYAHLDAYIKLTQQQIEMSDVSPEILAKAEELINQGFMSENKKVREMKIQWVRNLIMGMSFISFIFTFLIFGTLEIIYPQMGKKLGMTEIASFDLPIRINHKIFNYNKNAVNIRIAQDDYDKVFNMPLFEDLLIENIPIKHLNKLGTIQIVIGNDTIKTDSLNFAPTPARRLSLSTKLTCDDDIMNGDETGVDCGGSCISCDDLENYKKDAARLALAYIAKGKSTLDVEIKIPEDVQDTLLNVLLAIYNSSNSYAQKVTNLNIHTTKKPYYIDTIGVNFMRDTALINKSQQTLSDTINYFSNEYDLLIIGDVNKDNDIKIFSQKPINMRKLAEVISNSSEGIKYTLVPSIESEENSNIAARKTGENEWMLTYSMVNNDRNNRQKKLWTFRVNNLSSDVQYIPKDNN